MFDFTSLGEHSVEEVVGTMQKYERTECSSLLKLVISKAQNCDGQIFGTVAELCEDKNNLESDFYAATVFAPSGCVSKTAVQSSFRVLLETSSDNQVAHSKISSILAN